VAELSQLFTSVRKERSASYLGRPAPLSAYLRYFLPWNVFRLTRLFSSLPLELKPNDVVNDIGAGPLTLMIALWISRSEFRDFPLEFRSIDRTAAVLEAGKKLFAALAGANTPWKTRIIQGELANNGRLSVEIRGKPAALSAAVNVYNELFWNFSPFDTEGLERFAEKQARLLSSLTESSGSILAVEPGIPRSGEFIRRLRFFLMSQGRDPIAPCTHFSRCPLPGGHARGGAKNLAASKGRWCHFAFDTTDAPNELHKLTASAQLPKERAVLSFILAGSNKTESKKIRVISDVFPVNRDPGSWGRYGCSEQGLVLITGSRAVLENTPSGSVEDLPLKDSLRDTKSGALIAVKR
jgi:hypothetical protein